MMFHEIPLVAGGWQWARSLLAQLFHLRRNGRGHNITAALAMYSQRNILANPALPEIAPEEVCHECDSKGDGDKGEDGTK